MWQLLSAASNCAVCMVVCVKPSERERTHQLSLDSVLRKVAADGDSLGNGAKIHQHKQARSKVGSQRPRYVPAHLEKRQGLGIRQARSTGERDSAAIAGR